MASLSGLKMPNLAFPHSREDIDARLVYTAGAMILLPLTTKIVRSYFKRDVHSSFNNQLSGSVNLLNNKDSVLKRNEVKDSIDGYEKLFDGARKENGAITSEDSIKQREKEYQTMVNRYVVSFLTTHSMHDY